jgi:hypothetical protein
MMQRIPGVVDWGVSGDLSASSSAARSFERRRWTLAAAIPCVDRATFQESTLSSVRPDNFYTNQIFGVRALQFEFLVNSRNVMHVERFFQG